MYTRHLTPLSNFFFIALNVHTGTDITAETKDNKAEQIKIEVWQDYYVHKYGKERYRLLIVMSK